MKKTSNSGKIILLSLSGNLLITVSKFISFLISRSPSMMAETIHTACDSLNQLILFLGYKKGQLGPCPRYPLGQGRATYVFNLIAAIGIALAAIFTISHGYHGLSSESAHYNPPGLETYIILLVSIIVEANIFRIALRGILKEKGDKKFLQYLEETDDPSIVGVLFEDGIAIIGALVALFGIFISYKIDSIIPDSIATIIIGLLLLFMAFYLVQMNYKLIIGVSLPKNEIEKLKSFILTRSEVESIVHITTEVLAPSKVRLSLEIEFVGQVLGGHQNLKKDRLSIEQGKIEKTLVANRDRTLRDLGTRINDLEIAIIKNFPTIRLIDIEPY